MIRIKSTHLNPSPVWHRPASAPAVPLADFVDAATRTERIGQLNRREFQLWDPSNPERTVVLFVSEPFAMAELLAEALTEDLDGVPNRIASCDAAGRRLPPRP